MTTVQQPQSTSSYLSETYDPDDVVLRDSPLLQPIRPNLSPSSSPEPMVPLPEVSPECSPEPSGRKGSNRPKNRPSLGDAVLVHFMDGGKHLDISRKAGDEPLASDHEDGEDSATGGVDVEIRTERENSTGESSVASVVAEALEKQKSNTNTDSNATQVEKGTGEHLEALAQSAMRQIARNPSQAESPPNGDSGKPLAHTNGEAMEDVRPSIPEIHVGVARGTSNTAVKTETPLSTTEELPPIRQHSPQSALSNSNNAGQITLPSLSAQLGDINKIPDAPTPRDTTTFSQSPPALPPRFSAISGHGSPPKSPNDFRALPSPGRGGFGFYNSQHRRPSQSEGHPYSTPGDYSSSTETPSTDNSASTPAMGIDRMSIDNMTNPQIGGFQCTYPNCTASPFQTQYLLNSHANVHSQIRPHYCSVKGCPRSEGGKGFKRKNEMIRHGLVHDSPGYVCPFCPDREHKYPRPDNLQRHVRVHHVDKDKDDTLLRDVLAQRPEGPSRGRRRRGGTS